MEELNIIAENENEINSKLLLYGENCQQNFQKYYVLNKTWFDNYKTSLKIQTNNSLFMNVQDIFPQVQSKKISESKQYSYPTNFIVVNEKLFNQIYKHFQQNPVFDMNQLSYEVLIFGECVIIKSRVKPTIIYVSTLKKNCSNNNDTKYENEIRYIFEFNNEQYMKDEIKDMQNRSFNGYIKFKNLSSANSVNYREIKNKKGEIIGYIIYNSIEKKSETAMVIKNVKVQGSIINSISTQSTTKFNPYLKSILLGLNQFEDFTNGLKVMLKSNQLYKLTSEISKSLDNIMNNQNITNKILSEFNSSIQTGNYENIIREILFKLDKELNTNKRQNNNNNNNHFDEIQARQAFKMEHQNSSIIENLFYLTVQNKLYCEKCKKTMYYYEPRPFLLVELNGNENNFTIKDKLFEIKNKKVKCLNCSNDCKAERKFEEFPKILIAVIKSKNDEKFNLKNNFKILPQKQNNTFLYSLNCFIEKDDNFFYFKTQKHSMWYKFDINTNEKKECNVYIQNPSVIFFKGMFAEQKYQNYNQAIQNNNNNRLNNSVNNIMIQKNFKSNSNNNFVNNNMSMQNLNNNNMNINNMNNMKNINNNSMNNIINQNINMNNMNINRNSMNNINNPNINMNNSMKNNNQMPMNNMNNQSKNNNQMNMNNMNNFNNMSNQINAKNLNNINNFNNISNQMNNKNINNQMNMNNMNKKMNMPNQMNINNMNMNNQINNMRINSMNNMNNQMNFGNMNNKMPMNNQMNFNNMNNNMNNMSKNNSMNIKTDMVLNNINKNNQNHQVPQGNVIFVTFTFMKNKKQIYIDINENETFENTIKQLEEKYNWLRMTKNPTYFLNGNKIDNQKLSLKNLGISENSDIMIKCD